MIKSEHESILKLEKVVCLKACCERAIDFVDFDDLNMAVARTIDSSGSEIVVILEVNVSSGSPGFRAEVKMQGVFSISGVQSDKTVDILSEKNTVAILFPFVRSQMAVLTSQPGMEPIVLPAININAWIDSVRRSEN